MEDMQLTCRELLHETSQSDFPVEIQMLPSDSENTTMTTLPLFLLHNPYQDIPFFPRILGKLRAISSPG
jgi:hypothetical protein